MNRADVFCTKSHHCHIVEGARHDGAGETEGVVRIEAHMCRCGMTQRIVEALRFVRKPVSSPTNSPRIAEQLNRQWARDHPHVVLQGRARTEQAQIYPEQLCKAMCEGLRDQQFMDAQGLLQMGTVNSVDCDEMRKSMQPKGLHEENEWEEAWDDVTGKALKPELARVARKEIDYFRTEGSTTRCPLQNVLRIRPCSPLEFAGLT